jgi:hypothetical protein
MKDKTEKHNYYNTWEFVKDFQGELKNTENPFLKGLEHSWQVLSEDYNDSFPRALREDVSNFAATPVEALVEAVELGYYPSPEVLIAVCRAVDKYMSHHGELELEDVFFGDKVRSKGNYSGRIGHDSWYRMLWFRTTLASNKDKSISSLAEDLFAEFKIEFMDVDNFIRGYRRWKVRVGNYKKDT